MNADLLYANSGALAYACPPIRPSQPSALDNTQRFSFDEQRIVEPPKEVLCFDCQKAIEAGKGIQVRRHLRGKQIIQDEYEGIPIHTLVHPACNHVYEGT